MDALGVHRIYVSPSPASLVGVEGEDGSLPLFLFHLSRSLCLRHLKSEQIINNDIFVSG